jgi:hypothetical protein
MPINAMSRSRSGMVRSPVARGMTLPQFGKYFRENREVAP